MCSKIEELLRMKASSFYAKYNSNAKFSKEKPFMVFLFFFNEHVFLFTTFIFIGMLCVK